MPALILLAALSQIATKSPHPLTPSPPHPLNRAITTQGNLGSNALQLLQQGLRLYQAEQFPEAVKVLQQADQAFQTQGDQLKQALVLNYLSLAEQQMGQWKSATEAIRDSLTLLQIRSNKGNSKQHLSLLAQALNTQGQLQLALGQSEKALTSWDGATTAYTQIGDTGGIIGSQINLAQALQALGLYRRALITLKGANQTLQQQPDSVLKATGLLSLGNALRVVGDLDQKETHVTEIGSLGSRQVLEQSLAVAKRVQSPEAVAKIQLSLGNTAQAQQNTEEALGFYRQAATPSASPMTQLQAQLNQLHLLVETGQRSVAQTLLPTIQLELTNLPPSRKTVYARINFAQSLMQVGREESRGSRGSYFWSRGRGREQQEQEESVHTDSLSEQSPPASGALCPSAPLPLCTSAQLLATAVQQAKTLADPRAQAYALGTLGGVYEQTQQWSAAQDLTQQALLLAEGIQAPDIAYRWQWQLGRILKAPGNPQGNTIGAIAAYTKAVNLLKSLRSDLVAINPEVQFSFREEVEPIYRELVSLLLQSGGNEPSQKNLSQARDVIESLQLAELENFFRKACLNAQSVQIDQVDKTAAVIYPIILADRLEVILSLPNQLPNQSLRHYKISLPRYQFENTIEQLRQKLVTRTSSEFLPISQQAYNWLIRPLASELEKSKVKTLVFVLDGSLRNIPMAALNDGQHYLIEKYNIALTPGLQLLNPQPLARQRLRALVAGITSSRQDFSALPGVQVELNQIKSEVPTRELLNQGFTRTAFKDELKSFYAPVVHLATHVQFASKAKDTFILTWDARINVNDLNSFLQNRQTSSSGVIELLVLSACETAAGDKQAALGLAGVAVRSGARSTLGTLWVVSDEATTVVMGQFYKQLADTKVTKAEAIRRAQLTLLKNPTFKHPYFWAPYVMVGNWL